jgi:flagellar biosynthesis protein
MITMVVTDPEAPKHNRQSQIPARASNIPVLYDARLLDYLDGVEVGQEVPEMLFESVAVILSWAYWLRDKTPEDAHRD